MAELLGVVPRGAARRCRRRKRPASHVRPSDPLSAKAASLKRTRCIRRDDDHKAIFDYVDADADGYISLTEFRQFLRPKSRRRSSPRQAADKSRGNASAASDGDDSGLRLASPVSQLAAALSAPPAPASLPAASAELIEHCAEWVARHGQQFETILKNRNFGQPGWEFLFTTDTVSAGFYRQRLEYEMQQQISESAKRCASNTSSHHGTTNRSAHLVGVRSFGRWSLFQTQRGLQHFLSLAQTALFRLNPPAA